MKRSGLVLFPLLFLGPQALAQTVPAESGLRAELRLNALFHDNLFQAPDSAPQEDVKGAQVEGRLEGPIGAGGAWTGFARLSYTDYDSGLDPSQTIVLGLRRGSRVHRLEVAAEYANDRPSVDLDVVDQADVARLTGHYDLRPLDDWQFSLLGSLEQQRYARAAGRDNEFWSAAAALRYRGFGRGFSPEIGYGLGARDVDDPSQSYDQTEAWVRVISEPVEALYLALRYRLRQREYTVADALASNFGREDDRPQWSLTAAYRTGEHLLWNLYWAHESSDSSRAGVDFTTQTLVLGAGWRF
ncbi:MAG: DUF560 domain-containing protein [Thermoanaerobaculia bacterium]|nr:MAG: DUF560 domain-containing protein [Thermoanaerobaculia bacterium]